MIFGEKYPSTVCPPYSPAQSCVPMRKNPIQQKRGAMNIRTRVAQFPPENTPALSVDVSASSPPAPTSPPVAVVVPPQPVMAAINASPPPIRPVAPVVSGGVPRELDSFGVSDEKSDPYALSTIFVALLSGAKRSEILPLLRVGLAKAVERGDDLFTAIFEGGIAANTLLPDFQRAISSYHRAFDLCKRRTDTPNGFLHSMVWSLYTNFEDSPEAAELMARARRHLKGTGSAAERNNELLREAWMEFEALPTFVERFESYRTVQDKESTPVINKLLRESRLDATKILLLFPRNWRSRRTNDVKSFSSVVSQTCGNYFFWNKGFGTVINPDLTFVDNFYRLGGVLRDVHNIVLTVSSSGSGNSLSQFRTLFDLLRQANVMQSVRFFVRPHIEEENSAEFQRLEKCGAAESIRPLCNGSESELLGGGSLTFCNGSFLLSLENRKLQFLDHAVGDLESQAEELGDQRDLMVLPVETVEELVWTARQVQERKPKLVIFDLPKENSHLILLDASVRDYVGFKTPIAYADSALIVDVLAERFVDCVKAFAVSESDCWTEYSQLAFDPHERQLPEGLLYFERGAESRFTDEHREILEAFLYNRRCRRGLYFA